jgi:hypothetical protein
VTKWNAKKDENMVDVTNSPDSQGKLALILLSSTKAMSWEKQTVGDPERSGTSTSVELKPLAAIVAQVFLVFSMLLVFSRLSRGS